MWTFFCSIQYLYFCIAAGAFNPPKRDTSAVPTIIQHFFMLDGGVLYQFYLRSK